MPNKPARVPWETFRLQCRKGSSWKRDVPMRCLDKSRPDYLSDPMALPPCDPELCMYADRSEHPDTRALLKLAELAANSCDCCPPIEWCPRPKHDACAECLIQWAREEAEKEMKDGE